MIRNLLLWSLQLMHIANLALTFPNAMIGKFSDAGENGFEYRLPSCTRRKVSQIRRRKGEDLRPGEEIAESGSIMGFKHSLGDGRT
jgi:hypothetical protein